MTRPIAILVGVLAAVAVGTGVSLAVVRTGNDAAAPATTTSTLTSTSTSLPASTTTAPPTTLKRVTTTRVVTVSPTTPATARPAPTVATTTTTKVALTRAAATQALCTDLEAAVRLVVGGNTIGGGLRLTRAVNTYGDVADPSVVGPARRMLSAALSGDLDSSAIATDEAAQACRRLGFPVILPGGVQCIQAPCP